MGLPKSPSVIFSQTSDIIERQSSMASSTEEVSGNNDTSGGSRRDEAATEFGVFKDFDFLEYESESIEVCAQNKFSITCLHCLCRVRVQIISIGVYAEDL